MAADVGQAYLGWPREELSGDSQEVSASDHSLQSFGSFKFDSLDWERRSVFTRNKCQEELEKFKFPGLVAQKKAFFEEHYKKIRSMKATKDNQHSDLALDSSYANHTGKDERPVHMESAEDSGTIIDAHSDLALDGSLSNHTEQDERPVRMESAEDSGIFIDAHSTKASVKVVSEKKQIIKDLQVQLIDLGHRSSALDLTRGVGIEISRETSNHSALQMQTEASEQHDSINADAKELASKHERSELTSIHENGSSVSDVRNHHRDKQLTENGSVITAEINMHYQFSGTTNKDTSKKSCDLEGKVSPDMATTGTVLQPVNSDPIKKNRRIAHMMSKSHIRKYEDTIPYTKVKDASNRPAMTCSEKCKRSENRRGPEQVREGAVPSKYKSQQMVDKTTDNIRPSNMTSNGISRNCASGPAGSHKSLSSPCSKAAVRCLLSSVEPRNRDANRLDVSKRPAMTCSLKCKESENRWGSEQARARAVPPKYKSQQRVGKTKDSVRPSNMNGVSRVCVSGPAGSHKSLSDSCSKAAAPCPLSFGIERRNRDANLLNPSKRPAMTCSLKCKESENRWGSEQIRKRSVSNICTGEIAITPEPPKELKKEKPENKRGLEAQHKILPTSCMARVVDIQEPPKDRKSRILRPVILHAANHSHGESKSGSAIALRKDGPKEVAPSMPNPLAHKRKILSGCRSHNGTMPRQEMRPWR